MIKLWVKGLQPGQELILIDSERVEHSPMRSSRSKPGLVRFLSSLSPPGESILIRLKRIAAFSITCLINNPRIFFEICTPFHVIEFDFDGTFRIGTRSPSVDTVWVAPSCSLNGSIQASLDHINRIPARRHFDKGVPRIYVSEKKRIGVKKSMKSQTFEETCIPLQEWQPPGKGHGNGIFQVEDAAIYHGAVATTRNCLIPVDPHGLKLSGTGVAPWPSFIRWDTKELRYWTPSSRRTDNEELEEAVFITGLNNWYHFLIEGVTRIRKVSDQGLGALPLIVRDDLSPQMYQAIELTHQGNVIKVGNHSRICVRTLTVVVEENTTYGLLHEGSDVTAPFDGVNRDLWGSAFISENKPLRHRQFIYLMRSPTESRNLINRKELNAELHNLGFVCVNPADLTLQEQIILLSEARFVLAEAGAGVANIMFCTSGITVLLLQPPKGHVELWPHLAQAMELRISTFDMKQRYPGRLGVNGPFLVDVTSLVAQIKLLIAQSSA